MKCCDKNQDQSSHGGHSNEKKKEGHTKHILMMIACCGLPILLLALIPLIGGLNGYAGGLISRYAFLLCPILMIPMMFMMMGKSEKKNETPPVVKRIEDVR